MSEEQDPEYLFERYFAGKDRQKSLHKIAYRADNFKILTGFKMVLFFAFEGQKKRKKTGQRKNAITEAERNLYRKAVEKKGNDWKQILSFITRHKELLPPDVAKKYECAVRGEGIKSIRSRLGNIGRKVKNSQEVRAREERNIIEPGPSMTAENVILAMKTNKQAEASDPLNLEEHQASDLDEVVECPGELSVGNEEQAESAAAVFDVDVRSAVDSSDAEQQPLASAIPAAPKNKKVSKGKSKEREKALPKQLDKLTKKAGNLMAVGLKAAKLHMKYLKESAQSQGLELPSQSSSDSDESTD